MPKNQIACRPGHRASEHLYVLKSIIAYYQDRKKCLIFSGYDFQKFFDFENIFDCFFELHNSMIRGELYQLLYQMNRNVNITVKIQVWMTESRDLGPVISPIMGTDWLKYHGTTVVNNPSVGANGCHAQSSLPNFQLIKACAYFRALPINTEHFMIVFIFFNIYNT